MDITYHYPPELMGLLIDTIPLLCRGKKDTLSFFRGAGVERNLLSDLEQIVQFNKDKISKYEIARTVLTRLNEKEENALRERREVLKRVVEFESFELCWDKDRMIAKGLVSEIMKIVNAKDSLTRIKQEYEKEKIKNREQYLAKVNSEKERKERLGKIHQELSSLFSEKNINIRWKELERLLNELFKLVGIQVREAFTIKGVKGIIEQIDGVVQIEGRLYLVEMKWLKESIGALEISQHLVRVYGRGEVGGIFISGASSYTDAAIQHCKDALHQKVVVLCELREILYSIERGNDLVDLFKKKIEMAILEKKPFSYIF